jgi:hypothetical protein
VHTALAIPPRSPSIGARWEPEVGPGVTRWFERQRLHAHAL